MSNNNTLTSISIPSQLNSQGQFNGGQTQVGLGQILSQPQYTIGQGTCGQYQGVQSSGGTTGTITWPLTSPNVIWPQTTSPNTTYQLVEQVFDLQIRKVANGWIVKKGLEEYVCLTKQDVLSLIS